MVTVEVLYKYFGVLADAKEKAGEVSTDSLIVYAYSLNVYPRLG